ncbi:MAG: hypothetical protein FWF75_08780, partial [Propionibacteriaceae bacterium]|nr:hypothetical protein [Propionibacteriaceae bacterium]
MRQSHRLSHAFALIGAIALSASFLQMLPPGAAEAAVVQGQLPAPAFDNDTPEVLVSITSGSTTTMYTVDDTTMNLTAIPGSGSTISYDATGYRSADQYVYGIASGGRLVRIGSTGNVEVVGTIAALGSTMYNAGTFGTGAASDILYLRSASAGQIVAINFAGCTTGSGGAWDTGGTNATSCLTTTTYNFGTTSATNDLVYKNGELFSITASGQLLIIDLNSATGTNNTVTTSLVSVPGLPSASGYGAQWLYGNGNLAALNSDNNTIYQIDISDPTKPTIINSAPAPNNQGSSGRDGTNVPGHPVDLSLSKEVSVTDSGDAPAATTTFTPGQSLTYTFVVTNNSAYQSSGWSVADFLNNILSSDITQGDIGYPTWNGQGTPPAVYCSFASTAATTLTCNGAGLAPNTSSQPFEITVQTSKNTTTALANTAVVTGKEADPSDCSDSSSDDCNNDSTATANPALLQLTKTASPTDDLELGQNITYTFTLTNAGTQPLTNIQINDLGVVDVKATDDDGNPTDTSPAGGTFNGYTCANGQTNGSITLATQNSSTTCTATYGPITQADVDAGWVENTAQASYKVNGTGPTLDTDVKTADTKYQAPGQITLSKAITGTTMTPAKAASISDTITYQLVAKNTGTVTLNNVSIIDPLLGGSTQQEQLNKIGTSCKYSAVGSNTGHAIGDTAATNGEIVLGPGDEVTCSGLQYTLTQSDIDKGVVYNSATVTGNPVNDAPQVTAGSNA